MIEVFKITKGIDLDFGKFFAPASTELRDVK